MTANLNIKTNFIFTFDRIKNVSFSTKGLELPSISLGEAPVPTSKLDYSIPGEKLIFDKLNIRFLVDEDLTNYLELLNWFFEMRDPETDAGKSLPDCISDCQLTILSNNKNPLFNFTFVDVYPILLDVLSFDYSTQAEPQECTAQFAFSYFKKS